MYGKRKFKVFLRRGRLSFINTMGGVRRGIVPIFNVSVESKPLRANNSG